MKRPTKKPTRRQQSAAAPLILVAPSTAPAGAEFADWSISLSNRYTDAIIAAGGLPVILPASTSPELIAQAVSRCDGVLLTGGDDIDPKLYLKKIKPELAKTTGGHDAKRDLWEKVLIDEIFRQRKPMLGICRGQQMLNVALGGTLIVDIPSQVSTTLNHSQMARKFELVHDVTVTQDSLLAEVTGAQSFGVNSTHHQAVGRLAEPLRAVAHGPDGVIEALELKNPAQLPFLLTVQFHPERLLDHGPVYLRLFTALVQASARRAAKKI